jgi:HlyD family secretion protein
MKVDVFLITSIKDNIMRVQNGSGFKAGVTQDIFVVINGKAVKRTVNLGMSNFDYVQVKDNVKPGEVIITSDMSSFKNSKEINIKD